jgi:hypothetical protein
LVWREPGVRKCLPLEDLEDSAAKWPALRRQTRRRRTRRDPAA